MPAIDAVKTLHTALIDTVKGYESAEQEAEAPELKALFADMVELRRQDHAEIHRALVERGEAPREDGSFMEIVHRTVINVRAAVKGIGRDALSAFVSGEEGNLSAYDKAIDANAHDPELSGLLGRQKASLEERIDRMKQLADAA